MKYNLLIPALLVITIVSCKKESGSSPQVPLIKKWEHYNPFIGVSAYTYTYDKGRVEGYQVFNNYTEYLYSSDKVIVNSYFSGGNLSSRETYELDNNGYASERHLSTANQFTYYTIRPDGFVESEAYLSANPATEEISYYSNTGLLDSTRIYQGNILRTVTIYTDYDMDRTYTIGNDNFGRTFLGRRLTHPPLKYKRISLQQGITVNFTHSYVYDEQGRITKDERVASNNENYTDSYEYY